MADLRMDGVTVSGAIRFENVTLEIYNKLIALLYGLNVDEDKGTKATVPPQNPVTNKPEKDARLVDFGNKLREARVEAGFTRKELSELIGYSYVTIGAWENANATPSNLAVDELRKIFPQANLDYLLI